MYIQYNLTKQACQYSAHLSIFVGISETVRQYGLVLTEVSHLFYPLPLIPFCIFVKFDKRFYSFDNDKARRPYMTHSSAPSFLQKIYNFITYQVLIISVSVETIVIFCLSLFYCQCTLTDDKVVPARSLAWIEGWAVSGTCLLPFHWPGSGAGPFQAHARRFFIGLDDGQGRFRHMLAAFSLAWNEGHAVSGTWVPKILIKLLPEVL